ncbi:MAG: amidohydrolase family protein [bacterium]|nr:amidohydrolase family protein [bacterium]
MPDIGTPEFDVLLRGGTVHDGLGSPGAIADVGIRGGRIVAIGRDLAGTAREVRDCTGLWVLPGFVDIHTHYDLEVEISPGLTESIRHGVTSVVMGNCSLSVTMGEPGMLADMFLRVETLPRLLIEKWLARSVAWKTPREYVDHLATLPLGPSVAAFLGHSALRAHVMGLERSLRDHPTDSELARMRELAEEALAAGCLGISVDMVPWHMMSGPYRGVALPSHHARFREIAMLADVCRKRDAVFQITPNPQNLRSMAVILWVSLGIFRTPLRTTVLSALDAVANRRLWRAFEPLLFVFNRLLGGNLRFQTLTEPFIVHSDGPITPMFEEFPTGVTLNDQDTHEERIALWRDPAFRARFREEWTRPKRNTFHRDLTLMRISECPEPTLVGKTFAEVSAAAGREPVEHFMELLERHDTAIRWVTNAANDREAIRHRLMAGRDILPGFTDAGAHVRNLGYYDGALAMIRQAAASGFMPLEQAIARVTGEAARWFRLDRGVLAPGKRADLVVLDPARLLTGTTEQVEVADPMLDGALRMVKPASPEIVEVLVAGRTAVRGEHLQPVLGRERLGEVTSLAPDPRLRISRDIPEHPFHDYWDVFVCKHRNPWNVLAHLTGILMNYAGLVALLWTRDWRFLVLMPVSQVIGLLGHVIFERSHVDRQDAVFTLRASRCLNRLFWLVLTGRYRAEVARVTAELDAFLARRAAETSVSARAPEPQLVQQ